VCDDKTHLAEEDLGFLHPNVSYSLCASSEDRNPQKQATSPQKGWPKANIVFSKKFPHGVLLLLLLLTSSSSSYFFFWLPVVDWFLWCSWDNAITRQARAVQRRR
jgi:hypothetical protein